MIKSTAEERIKVLGVAELPGFRCVEHLYPPSFELALHEHERPNVSVCLSGSVREVSEAADLEINAGATLIRPAHTMHSNYFGRQHLRALVIEIGDEAIRRHPLLADLTAQVRLASSVRVTSLAGQIADELRRRHPARLLSIEGLLLRLLAELNQARNSETISPSWLRDSVHWMRGHYLEPIGVKEIARRFGVNPAHYARTFKKQMQSTVAQFVRRLRIEHAAAMLVESDRSISQIGLDCGFADQAHFTRAFKSVIGTSPGSYRRLLGDETATGGDEN